MWQALQCNVKIEVTKTHDDVTALYTHWTTLFETRTRYAQYAHMQRIVQIQVKFNIHIKHQNEEI